MKSEFRKSEPAPTLQSSRALRWTVAAGAIAMVSIGLVLLYLLTQATNNREMDERNYGRLFIVNVVVATALFGAILWVGYRLFERLRQGRFGSRLLVKLATIFALVGVAPTKRRPCSPRAARRVDSNARSYCARMERAISKNALPACVNSTPRARRRKS